MACQGVMSEAIPWKLLQDQYFSDSTYEDEIAKLVHSPEEVSSWYSWLLFYLLSFISCIVCFTLLQYCVIVSPFYGTNQTALILGLVLFSHRAADNFAAHC